MTLPPFQQVLDAHGRDVHRFLLAMVGPTDADDCYQETWLSALRAYPKLREASNLRGWIFTIAHHKAIDLVRAKRREAIPSAEPIEMPATDRQTDLDHDIWASVRGLPAKQRTALAMRYVADAAYSEISAAMGTSEEAARRNVHEGLKRLRKEHAR